MIKGKNIKATYDKSYAFIFFQSIKQLTGSLFEILLFYDILRYDAIMIL